MFLEEPDKDEISHSSLCHMSCDFPHHKKKVCEMWGQTQRGLRVLYLDG